MNPRNRRDFLRSSALLAGGAALPTPAAAAASKMIGIQVGAVSFQDEGVEPVLDNFQKLANVNTLFIATFTYGRGIAGRQVPDQPLPHHGKEDVFRDDLPNIQQVQEKDFHGRNARTLCLNNPSYRNFLLGIVEDWGRSYEIDGIMWGSERQGAFSNALGASHGGASRDPARVTCFCSYCQAKAKERGVSSERARAGFTELEQFVGNGRGESARWTVTT